MSEIKTAEAHGTAHLKVAGVLAAGLAAQALTARQARAATPAVTFASSTDIPGAGDVKILNFALLLERLETELYVQAVQRLQGGGSGGRDAAAGTNITPIAGVSTSTSPSGPGADLVYYKQFVKIEQEHRDFLESALGNAAIPVNKYKFTFNINNLSRRQLLDLVLAAEATGVKAYLGALPKIKTPATAQTAAAIQGTEARHTTTLSIVNNFLVTNGVLGGQILDVAPLANQNNGRDGVLEPQAVLDIVQDFIVRT
ncbi:MAG TPA: ferritin-like domain-containing protein [Abditibacteriaceae bacterium]|jgi:hypothetical protein